MERKLPIGIQGFQGLRNDGYIYVDKTEYIYRLVHHGKPYFLSRPRRFGKSLLLSTIKAYWEGKKELFSGLAIEDLEKNNPNAWKPHPVFYFDFNGANYEDSDALEKIIDEQLRRWEDQYAITQRAEELGERFRNLIIAAFSQTETRVVILVDEYDKPLLDAVEDQELQNHNKAVFKGFFSTLKSFDEYIQFIFITGVTKFHKVSIFSDLNQLNDISLLKDYAGLCGITEDEMQSAFSEEIDALAKEQGMTQDKCLMTLKQTYDGYHFHPKGVSVYNPFSLLNAFYGKDFGSYWYETGTPTFLMKKVKEQKFDPRKFTNKTIYASEAVLKDYTGDSLELIPLLYQTGYLTIAEYEPKRKRYTLCFPNDEVQYGFLESLLPTYSPAATVDNGLDIFTLDEYLENGQLDEIRNFLTALFANITYTTEADLFEHYFQSVIYVIFTLLGKIVDCEKQMFTGRIDCKVETENYIYLFEFKRDKSAQEALDQINSKEYALPFVADSRTLYKIGVSFDSQKRKLVDWVVEM